MSELTFGATSEAAGSSGPILALSLTSRPMGDGCWESGGGSATEVTRAGGDFWFCSCISTSESMFCIDESQDMRQRGRRLTGDSTGNTKLEKSRKQQISEGEARDKTGQLESEKPEGERRCQKRKFPGGGGGDRARQAFERGRQTWPVRRKFPSGGVAESAPYGYQSNPIQSVPSAPPHGEILSPPFTSPPERMSTSLAQFARTNSRVG
jgi:hypothetical protein